MPFVPLCLSLVRSMARGPGSSPLYQPLYQSANQTELTGKPSPPDGWFYTPRRLILHADKGVRVALSIRIHAVFINCQFRGRVEN